MQFKTEATVIFSRETSKFSTNFKFKSPWHQSFLLKKNFPGRDAFT